MQLAQSFSILGPDMFVYGITEVRGFLWGDAFPALTRLVFLESSIRFHHTCVVHADEGVAATSSIDT